MDYNPNDLSNLEEEIKDDVAEMMERAAAEKTRTNKQDVLISVFSEPIILRLMARSVFDGQSASFVRLALEKRLNEQYRGVLEKHGAKLPLKIFHPEFLSALRTALELKVESIPAGSATGDVFRDALQVMTDRSQKAREAMAKRKPAKKSRRDPPVKNNGRAQ